MLKIKSILVSLLAIAALASCSTDEADSIVQNPDLDVAYMSLRITLPTQKPGTRAVAGSSEEKGPVGEEGTVNSLYIITFDSQKRLVRHAKKNPVTILGSGDLSLQASGNQGTTLKLI